VGGTLTQASKDGAGISKIAKQLSALLDEQMAMIVGRGFQDLTDAELAAYEFRRKQIARLRSELETIVNTS
jgi:hypothetical protein